MMSRSLVYKKLENFYFFVVVCVIDFNYELFVLSDYERKSIYEIICCFILDKYLIMVVKCKYVFFLFVCKLFFDFFEL